MIPQIIQTSDVERKCVDLEEMEEIIFTDEFDEEVDICYNCGSESATLIGYNREKDIDKVACANCHCVFIDDRNGTITMIKGNERNWPEHLSSHLKFPFDGVVDDFQEHGPLQAGDKVVVMKILGEDSLYGVVAEVKSGGRRLQFPIVDIAVKDKKSSSCEILDDYRTWFANCR